jgi:16S rRNA (guanine527-N7)-methyltransferase
MSIFFDTLSRALERYGIRHTREQISLCEEYFKLVASANEHMNLTRITDEEQAALRHFADAARLLEFFTLPEGCRVIDIGSGAGFPGIPLKILRPNIDLTLLDSSGKKTDFISASAESLNINVTVVCARAEEAAKTYIRGYFDAAVSRAMAPLDMLLELCVPFLCTGGTLAAWKGESYEEELSEARGALATLHCYETGSHFIDPGAIILIEKQKPTPDIYPRRFAKIKQKPL